MLQVYLGELDLIHCTSLFVANLPIVLATAAIVVVAAIS